MFTWLLLPHISFKAQFSLPILLQILALLSLIEPPATLCTHLLCPQSYSLPQLPACCPFYDFVFPTTLLDSMYLLKAVPFFTTFLLVPLPVFHPLDFHAKPFPPSPSFSASPSPSPVACCVSFCSSQVGQPFLAKSQPPSLTVRSSVAWSPLQPQLSRHPVSGCGCYAVTTSSWN